MENNKNKNDRSKSKTPDKDKIINNNKASLTEIETNPNEKITGELRKLKTTGVTLFSNTNLRWCELDFSKKRFSYKKNRTDPEFKEFNKLGDFLEIVYELKQEDKKKSKWKFGFYLKFKSKTFTLYAENQKEYQKWKDAFTRVYNIFIKYKEIHPEVFQNALNKFAKPYYEELEKEKLRKLEEERKKKEVKPKPEPIPEPILEPPKKINNIAEELGVKKTLEPKTSDIYSSNLKKTVDEELDNIGFQKKNEIVLNDIIKPTKKNSELKIKNDLDDWDFYDNDNKKINPDKLLEYNPVLKRQRSSLSPALRKVTKGYIANNKECMIENTNQIYNDVKGYELKTSKKTVTYDPSVSFILEFKDEEKEIKDPSLENNTIKLFNNTVKEKKNNILFDEDFVELGNMNEDIEKRKNNFKKKKNNDMSDDLNQLLSEDKTKENEDKFLEATKFNNFKNQGLFILEKIEKNDDPYNNYGGNNKYDKQEKNNLDFTKFNLTKKMLLEDIKKKNSKISKIKNNSSENKNGFENFEFSKLEEIQVDPLLEEFKKKDELIESFYETEKKLLNNEISLKMPNSKTINKSPTKIKNEDENTPNKLIFRMKTTNFETRQGFEKAKESALSRTNTNLGASMKNSSFIDRYVPTKKTEYLNENLEKSNFDFDSNADRFNFTKNRDINSLSKSKERLDVNKNKLNMLKKERLSQLIYGKKDRNQIEEKVDFDYNFK